MAAQDTVGLGFFCCKSALLTHALLGVHQHCQVFLSKAAFQLTSPQCLQLSELLLSRCRTLNFCLLNFMRFLYAPFSGLPNFPSHGGPICGTSAMPPHFASPTNSLRVHSSQVHRSIKKILNSASPRTQSCSLESLVPCLWVNVVQLITNLWAQLFSQSLNTPHNPYSSACLLMLFQK